MQGADRPTIATIFISPDLPFRPTRGSEPLAGTSGNAVARGPTAAAKVRAGCPVPQVLGELSWGFAPDQDPALRAACAYERQERHPGWLFVLRCPLSRGGQQVGQWGQVRRQFVRSQVADPLEKDAAGMKTAFRRSAAASKNPERAKRWLNRLAATWTAATSAFSTRRPRLVRASRRHPESPDPSGIPLLPDGIQLPLPPTVR